MNYHQQKFQWNICQIFALNTSSSLTSLKLLPRRFPVIMKLKIDVGKITIIKVKKMPPTGNVQILTREGLLAYATFQVETINQA